MSSLDLLLLLMTDMEAELEIKADHQHDSAMVGSALAALRGDARVVCFVCKVAQELAQHANAVALSGAECDIGFAVLGQIMVQPNVQYLEFFFSLIIYHGGESSLASLLRPGGQLFGCSWCRSLQDGLPSSRGRVESSLRDAERCLAAAIEEEISW